MVSRHGCINGPLGLAALALAGCGDLMATRSPGERGYAEVAISLGGMDSPLGKRAAASDTVVTLRNLFLELSAPGLPLQGRTVALSENIRGGSVTPPAQLIALWGPRNWKVKAWTTDAADSVLHKDSTTLYVEPGDTTALSLSLNPRFSVLVGRFISESSKIAAIERLELVVNGTVVDDTTFINKEKKFDVVLSDKYLRLGQASTIEMRALDRISPPRVKYSKSVILDPGESVDSTITIQLDG